MALDRLCLTIAIDMQHITSALILGRRVAIRARVWSVGFVAPSFRNNYCALVIFLCIFLDTNHVPVPFYLFYICLSFLEGGGLAGQSCEHLACASISQCISNTCELDSHSFWVFPCLAPRRAEGIWDEITILLLLWGKINITNRHNQTSENVNNQLVSQMNLLIKNRHSAVHYINCIKRSALLSREVTWSRSYNGRPVTFVIEKCINLIVGHPKSVIN